MAGYNITKAIYDKYIVPTIGNHGDGIGVELEIPILNLKKEPVNFSLIQETCSDYSNRFGISGGRSG